MSKTIPAILFMSFQAEDATQLWAFSVASEHAGTVMQAFDDADWPQDILDDIEADYGTLDFVSSPCDEVHGIGFITCEIPIEKAQEVMITWHNAIAEHLGEEDVVGEVHMLQEHASEVEPEFQTDLDIYRLYAAA